MGGSTGLDLRQLQDGKGGVESRGQHQRIGGADQVMKMVPRRGKAKVVGQADGSSRREREQQK